MLTSMPGSWVGLSILIWAPYKGGRECARCKEDPGRVDEVDWIKNQKPYSLFNFFVEEKLIRKRTPLKSPPPIQLGGVPLMPPPPEDFGNPPLPPILSQRTPLFPPLLDKIPFSNFQSFINTLVPESTLLLTNNAKENSVRYLHPQFPMLRTKVVENLIFNKKLRGCISLSSTGVELEVAKHLVFF